MSILNDPYEILGVGPSASAADIKRAFRILARERHPDVLKNDPWAEEEFKTITVAYDILSNERTRAQYDRGEIDGLGTKRAGGGWQRSTGTRSGAGFNNGKSNAQRTPRQEIKVNGADVEYQLTLSFLDAARGGVKHISTTNGKRLKVTVPAGINDKATLRLKGQGTPGVGGGKPGDALVEISVMEDPTFRRIETDIQLDLPITLTEAVLGAKVEVPTIDGLVSLTVPPASNTGTILRLKGKGLPLTKTTGKTKQRGDQFVTLQVVLPNKQDAEFTQFVKDWSAKHSYTVARNRTPRA